MTQRAYREYILEVARTFTIAIAFGFYPLSAVMNFDPLTVASQHTSVHLVVMNFDSLTNTFSEQGLDVGDL